MIKSWEKFNELKKYSDSDMAKDVDRIESMVRRSTEDGKLDKKKLIKLATTMANTIKSYDKAYYRGLAAEEENYHDVAKIFYNRADEIKDSE